MSGHRIGGSLARKSAELKRDLSAMGRVLVAFSGGVDSTLLLKVAHDTLGKDVLAVTASAEIHPRWEVEEAVEFARTMGVRHRLVRIKALSEPAIASNPPDRCYHCKRFIFSRLLGIARREGIPHVLDGTNADDRSDFRPGERALRELGVRSPLRDAGLTKRDIRRLSASLGLSTADKPSYACLASRFPYHTELDGKSLRRVEAAEKVLMDLGFRQARVRHYGRVALIEVEPGRIGDLARKGIRDRISRALKNIGYDYVALDLDGYRTGSLNEPFRKSRRKP
jgi:uncharacterized protein